MHMEILAQRSNLSNRTIGSQKRWNPNIVSHAEQGTTQTCWTISMWNTALRLWTMSAEITEMLMYLSRPFCTFLCCRLRLKKDLLKIKKTIFLFAFTKRDMNSLLC